MTIGVVVVDDQALVRGAFRVLVDSASDLEVLGEASNGAEALELVKVTRPDLVLMDVRMPVMDGIEATSQILAGPGGDIAPRILILTTFDLDEYVYAALRAGASGFMLKDTPPEELLSAIRVVAGGDALLAPSVTRRLIAEFATQHSRSEPTAAFLSLTEREREVFGLVAKGLSNQELAEVLHISAATAKTHVSRVLMKLEARDRAQLVVLAYETGFIVPG